MPLFYKFRAIGKNTALREQQSALKSEGEKGDGDWGIRSKKALKKCTFTPHNAAQADHCRKKFYRTSKTQACVNRHV